MTPDEATHLLAKPAADSTCCPEECNGKTITVPTRQKTALWQIGALCGILLAYADTSLVWATHETIASNFNHLPSSSWMMTSFTIGYCVTLPLYGRLSDNYGRLRPLITAYGIFCLGCTLCGVGQAYWQVIIGRTMTGCGASGMVCMASIIITDLALPTNVAVLRSYVNIAATAGLSLGGPFGGILGGTIGWRWSFLCQIPIATGCCALIARGVQDLLPILGVAEDRQLEEPGIEPKQNTLSFDFSGAITLAIGIASLLTVIDLQNQLSWGHPLILGLTIVGTIFMSIFLVLETFPGNRELLMPLRLLKTEIGAFCAGQFLLFSSGHGFISQIAPYFANTQGASDAEAGGQTVPASIGNAIGALIAGQIIKRYGNYKKFSLIFLLLLISTTVLILFQWSHPIDIWVNALTTLPFGIFGGIVLSAQFIGLYSCAPKHHMATAITMYYMSRQIGIAVGISISSSVLQQHFERELRGMLATVPGYKQMVRRILDDSSVVAQLPTAIKLVVRQSFLNGFWVVPALTVSLQVLALLPTIFMSERHLD